MAVSDSHSIWGSQISSPPQSLYVPDKEIEGELAYSLLRDAISKLTPPVDLGEKTHWISPAARYAPALVDALNTIYPQHVYQKTFQWEIIMLNERKNI